MRTFTSTEIDLCKKIAEKEKRKKERGDWVKIGGKIQLVTNSYDDYFFSGDGQWQQGRGTLIWQEHDCLEWLRKKKYEVNLHFFNHLGKWMIQLWDYKSTQACYSDYDKENKNSTILEALLRAVLAVMEGK